MQVQFVGVTVDGRWSELRGDHFSEVRNTLVLYRRVNRGQVVWLL